MSRPIKEPSAPAKSATQDWRASQLERRPTVWPGPWHYVDDTDEPAFQNGWVNAGASYQHLRFRDTGMGTIQIQGVVMSGTPPSVVFTIPATSASGTDETFPLPLNSIQFAGSHATTWQVDPSGDVWIIESCCV